MKHRQLWGFLAGIAFLSAVFWFLNFHIANSNTQFQKTISTASIGEGLPESMQRREKIYIAMVGEGPLIAVLQKALTVEMKNAGIGDIELVEGSESKYQNPVLIVKVGIPNLLWTPFFATSRINIQTGYSSSGDTAFMEVTPVTIDNKNGPALNMYSECELSDRSWGLISRPGYHQILADYLAQQFITIVKDLYKV